MVTNDLFKSFATTEKCFRLISNLQAVYAIQFLWWVQSTVNNDGAAFFTEKVDQTVGSDSKKEFFNHFTLICIMPNAYAAV